MTLTYKCAMCGGTYESDRDDEEVLSEMRSFFGGIKKEECAVVCEDCFQKIHPAEHPEKVEDAVAKTLRKRGLP